MSSADAVYRERAHLVALLASIYPSVITPASVIDRLAQALACGTAA